MTRSSKSRRARRRKPSRGDDGPPSRDAAVYMSLLLVGGFGVGLAFLLTGGDLWRHATIGYVALIAALINMFAIRAYFGGRLMRWQQSLARVTLRLGGYGRKGGKPLSAAHGQPDARTALLVGLVICIVVVAGGLILLFPSLIGRT